MKNVNVDGKEYVFDINKFRLILAKLRKDHDFTQSELADKLNLTRQAVSRYENGDSFPDISILLSICEVFGVSIDDLIGIKTNGEKKIIDQVVKGNDIHIDSKSALEDLIHLAPILKPSVLEKAVNGFKSEGINIESIVQLVQYLTDKSLYQLIINADFSYPNTDLLRLLLPFMDDDSKWTVFDKILEGKVDYHFLEYFIPACKWINTSLIEAAVVEGVLEEAVLDVMREANRKVFEMKNKSMF